MKKLAAITVLAVLSWATLPAFAGDQKPGRTSQWELIDKELFDLVQDGLRVVQVIEQDGENSTTTSYYLQAEKRFAKCTEYQMTDFKSRTSESVRLCFRLVRSHQY